MDVRDRDEVDRTRMLEDELRPDLSAEAFSPRMRIGLFMIVMVGEALMAFIVASTMFWDKGLLDASPFLAAYLGGLWIALGFYLMVIFGALVGNNPRLDGPLKMTWLMSFLVVGPVTIPAYWILHVWPAPYVPWLKPHVARPASNASLPNGPRVARSHA